MNQWIPDSDLQTAVREVSGEVRRLRRQLHSQPELSGEELNTAEMVMIWLSEAGLDVKRVGKTGVVGLLTGEPGPVIALRADMDALPLTDAKSVEYRSQVEGVMHGCGHDAHVAMLLGAARIMSGHQNSLKGSIRLFFQASEESPPGGALELISAGWLDGVKRICGIHVWNGVPTGKVWVGSGPVTAAADRFTVSIQGRGGHGALPHQCVDSVIVGSSLVMELQTIVSRRLDPVDSAVVTVGMIEAGSNFNVIADSAVLRGTVRTFDDRVRTQVRELMEHTVNGVCALHGATGELDYMLGYPPTVCDPAMAELIAGVCRNELGPDSVVDCRPMMGGEDFAYYTQRVPGTMMFLGSGGTDPDAAPPHHHPLFDIDEKVLGLGVGLWCKSASAMLSQE